MFYRLTLALTLACSLAAAPTTEPTTRPHARPRAIYFDQIPRDLAVPAGFRPAIVEAGGRYTNAIGREDSYFVGGYNGPNQELDLIKVRFAALRTPAGTLYVIDNETDGWSTDVRRRAPADVKRAVDRYVAWSTAMRAGNPTLTLAVYDLLPRGEVYAPGYHAQAVAAVAKAQAGGTLTGHEAWLASMAYRATPAGWARDDAIADQFASRDYYAWRAAGDADVAAGLPRCVDVITPSVYLYGDIDPDTMLASVGEVIAEARRLCPTAKVYPFIWPRYHQDESQQPPLDYWRQYVRLVLTLADGCVLWGAKPIEDKAYIDVVREEAERAGQPASP